MDKQTARMRLNEARDQLHRLMMGKAHRVLVDQNGERVEYTATSVGGLKSYIRELEEFLDPASSARGRGPLRFVW